MIRDNIIEIVTDKDNMQIITGDVVWEEYKKNLITRMLLGVLQVYRLTTTGGLKIRTRRLLISSVCHLPCTPNC